MTVYEPFDVSTRMSWFVEPLIASKVFPSGLKSPAKMLSPVVNVPRFTRVPGVERLNFTKLAVKYSYPNARSPTSLRLNNDCSPGFGAAVLRGAGPTMAISSACDSGADGAGFSRSTLTVIGRMMGSRAGCPGSVRGYMTARAWKSPLIVPILRT